MIQTGNSIVIRIYHNRNQEMIFVPLRQDMTLKLTKSGKKAVKETLGTNVSEATVADVIKATKEDGALMKNRWRIHLELQLILMNCYHARSL